MVLAATLGTALVGPTGRATAGFEHTFTTNAAVTIADGDFLGTGPPRDGVPDTFYPDGRPPGTLNAFYGDFGPTNNREHRGVIEFDVSTLSGITLTSATLKLFSTGSGGASTLSGYYGDGAITLDDWYRINDPITTLPQYGNASIDVLAFIQGAIDSGHDYVGFVIWQSPVQKSNGRTFEKSGQLVLGADQDFGVPPPLGAPPYSGSDPPHTTPEPSSMVLAMIGIGSLLPLRTLRRSRSTTDRIGAK
ncbi:hypothetical protein [Gemmata massiliana]|uniref:hypothetical protein n=1 Tax=Gemmata massiliana TaxID=1210884 RepID=UPI0013A6FA18|nr:hypothetical protein [Gemmata massiliana]